MSLTAKQLMSTGIVTIRPEATIQEAIDLLLNKGISGLPVTDTNNVLVGIITEYALLAMAYDKRVLNDTVAQHMTCEVLSVDVDDPVSRVADLCILHRVRRLPVLSGGQLVGLLSRRDLIKALSTQQAPVCTA